jgi:hypothetical protein
MIHLVWILLSFIFPIKVSMFLCFVVLTPIYLWEFIVVYGLRVPVVQDLDFFKNSKKFFPINGEDSLQRSMEQFLYFVILVFLFLTLSSFKLLYHGN